MHLQDRIELSRVAVDGKDAESGARVEVIAVRFDNGWELYVPARSHNVRLNGHAAAELSHAMSPNGPAEIVVSIKNHTGEWTHVDAPVAHGRDLPEGTLTSLAGAVAAALTRVKRFGWSPPARARVKRTT